MTTIQYLKQMDLYRVWEWNEVTKTINVKFCTLDEVLYVLSTEESLNSGIFNLKQGMIL